MKKVCLLGIVAILLLSLCACHVEPSVGSTAAAPSDIATTTAPSNTYTTTPDGTTAPPADVDITLKTDGWVNMENSDGQRSAFALGGYYHCAQMGSQILAFTDISNGTTVVLCSKPGCKHHEETSQTKQAQCDAYLGSAVFLLYAYGDKIYYNSDDDGYGGVDLYSRNADGTGKQKIAELGEEYVTGKSSITIGYYLPVGSKLYYAVDVTESVQNEAGVNEIKTIKKVLLCLDLDSGKETLIGEFTDEHPHMIAAREDQLLFYTVERMPDEDITQPDYFDKLDELTVLLKVWDATVGQCDTVFEKLHKDWPGNGFVVDSSLCYNETSGWFAYDLATGRVETTDLVADPLGDRYLLHGSSVYDTQEKTSLPNEFAAQGLRTVDSGDAGFILEKVYWKESTGGWKEADYIVYAYVTYDALADGLQSADCLDFLTLDR